MSQFKSDGDDLLINGIPVTQIAQRVGQTPFYAYDRSVIQQQVNKLRQSLAGAANIHYAIKANPMPAVVDLMAPLVDGLDVASGKELRVALDSGALPATISFAGPGKSEKELTMAVASGVTINIESEIEFNRVVTVSKQLNIIPRVAIRVNPDFQLKTSGMKMAGGPQQFGVDAERVPALVDEIKKAKFNFHGFHIFTGSQNLNPDAIIEAHNNIFELAKKLKTECDITVPSLNIGGGFGIPYFPGEKHLDIEPVTANIKRLTKEYSNEFGKTEVILELGRFLVGEAGVFICQVTDIKESRGELYAIVDGGLHHHLAASGNFGQVIRKNYPVNVANKMSQDNVQPINVVGPLCTPLDLLAQKLPLPNISIGDYIVIYQSGAYGFTASPKDFLSHPAPVEVLI